MSKPVSLFVNCFERDYREVLSSGFMNAKAGQFRFPFERKVVTINNVTDRGSALELARAAVHRREVDGILEVEKELPRALQTCGLSRRHLGRVRHYIDFALVAVTAAEPGFILYCCAEVDMEAPFDWISDAVSRLSDNPRYLVANPSWASDPNGPEREAIRREGSYWVGRGFSDQCFLADASRLARPIYQMTHPEGDRYPMSDIGDIFEKRVDAYMRSEGLLRLTDSRVSYRHRGIEGTGYPKPSLWRRCTRKLRSLMNPQLRRRSGAAVSTGREGRF